MSKITTQQIFEYLEDTSKELYKPESKISGIMNKLKEKFPNFFNWIISKKDYNIASNKEVLNVIDMLINGNIDEKQAKGQVMIKFAYNESSEKSKKLFTSKKKKY